MNSVAAGKRALAKVKEDVTDNGYRILESHISRGPADLLVGKVGERLAIQVKRSWGASPRPEEWNALIDLAAAFEALPIVAIAAPRLPVQYRLITGRKDGTTKRQPWRHFSLDLLADGGAA